LTVKKCMHMPAVYEFIITLLASSPPEVRSDNPLVKSWEFVREFISKNKGEIWFQIAAGLIALIILYKISSIIMRAITGSTKNRQTWLGKRRIRRVAEKHLKRKEYLRAGELFIELSDTESAMKAFREGRLWLPAGEAYAKAGKWREAASCYERAEMWERAAALYEDAGLHEKAIRCMEKTTNRHGLVQILERAREHGRAAEIHIELGNQREAAKCYERAHNFDRAADILYDLLKKEYLGKAKARAKTTEFTKRIGELYLRAKKPEKAAEVFDRGEEFARAADVYAEMNNLSAAGECYESAGEIQKAAEMYERAGEGGRAATLRAELKQEAGKPAEAAQLFKIAGQCKKAADLFFSIRDFNNAAEMFEEAEEYSRAGEAFAMGGNYRNAAAAYAKDHNWRQAADCSSKAGDQEGTADALSKGGKFCEAGEIYFEIDDVEKAIENLQQVKNNDPNYFHAVLLLAESFIKKAMFGAAREKLELITGENVQVTEENIEATYLLAVTAQEEGNLQLANKLFEKVLAVSYSFRDGDAASRAKTVKEKTSVYLKPASEGEPHPDSPIDSGIIPAPDGSVMFHPPRYEMVKEIGRGGMGLVYRMKDTVLARDIAFKTLGAGLRDNPKALDNFLKEAKAAAALNHPNIVTLFDIGEFQGTHFLTMEYVEGKTIKEILRAGKKIPLAHVYGITRQMCEALEYAHKHKIVHRDIKTANIMVTTTLQVKILDFGLARVVEEMTMDASKVVGTPSYMSPEQILGKNIDHRTDIYSLGVSLFEVVAQRLPFKGGNVGYHHLNTQPPDPRTINPEVPDDMANIILKCLEKDQNNRYQHASDILPDIHEEDV